jgi:RimJ/RimL family protein N-acetyltransferase
MHTRSLSQADLPALQALLESEAEVNLFHLGGLREHGLANSVAAPQGRPWAVGAFRCGDMVGVMIAFRGTGGVYHSPGDEETLSVLADVVVDRASAGSLSLLSGHASQIGPLLPLVGEAGIGQGDACYFRTLYSQDLILPGGLDGFGEPRRAGDADMDRLIDFYEIGFYSLAHLPTREAWRNRLVEQLAFRTLYIIEDLEGAVVSAALSSAECSRGAMLGGVATRVAYRGLGLSSRCVGALCAYLFRRGMSSTSLFYLKDNTPAARVYDKLGFAQAGEWLLVPLGMGASFAPLLGLRPR